MAQKKKDPTTKAPEPEIIEEGTSQLPVDPSTVRSFLSKQATAIFEPGFLKIENQKKVFTGGSFGSAEEFIGLIVSVEPTASLWIPDAETEAKKWLEVGPICSARNMEQVRGHGTLNKPVDDETPVWVREHIQPIVASDFRCVRGKAEGCVWSAFGTDGRGQLCKEGRRLLIWSPDSGTYGVLSLSPTSLKPWREYLSGLTDRDYTTVLTRFALLYTERGSQNWGILQFKPAGEVTDDHMVRLGKTVFYKAMYVPEAEATVNAFLGLELDQSNDYPTEGTNGTTKQRDNF
ncbi:hypothetical protein LCGC14_0504220 [marine sediment metagenome]|uniref:Uncharacterized protein n=1 Tax=marine sediment metagenome TaxID=412755 RepID=A0A0F9SLI6_9ZZZZ